MSQPAPARLQTVPLFTAIDSVDLELIASQLRLQHWPRHQLVMTPEATINRYYVILSGRVKVSVQDPDSGRELILHLLRAGDGHDLIPLLDGKPHQVQALTLDSVEVVSAPLTTWRRWLADYPPLRQALLYYAARQLRELSLLAGDLALHDTSTRLAHLLLRNLADTDTGDDHPLGDLVHEELAQLIGSVRIVVNRAINRFKHEGIIHTAAGQLRISNMERLLQKAETRFAAQLRTRVGSKPSPDNSGR